VALGIFDLVIGSKLRHPAAIFVTIIWWNIMIDSCHIANQPLLILMWRIKHFGDMKNIRK